MLNYTSERWTEGTSAPGRHTALLFSRAARFDFLTRSKRALAVRRASFDNSSISLLGVTSSGHQIELTDEDSMTLMFPVRGRLEVVHDRRLLVKRDGGLLGFGPSRRQTRVMGEEGDRFAAYMLKAPVRSAPFTLAQPPLGPEASADPLLVTRKGAAAALGELIRYILTDLASETPLLLSDRSAALVEALLIDHVEQLFLDPATARSADQPAAIVREAEDYMRAYFPEPMRIEDIARALGITPRHLQSAFRRSSGCSPWERLTAIRLDEVRHRLLAGRGECTVTGVAMDCGFSHLGRFAQTYQSTYRELPSTTLRRARRDLN